MIFCVDKPLLIIREFKYSPTVTQVPLMFPEAHFLKHYLFYAYEYMPLCYVYMHQVPAWFPQRSEQGIRSS